MKAPPKVMGVHELAERLGTTPERARTVSRRRGFPEPCAQITLGRIWDAADVEAWVAEHWRRGRDKLS
jgi:hypothetical protein